MSYDVAIDAGHAGFGVTPGKRTPAGEYEWNFNNIAAVACINHLEANGVKTYRLDDRTGRTDVSLAERTRRANNSGARALVSIHANANTGVWSAGWGGTETYVPGGNNSGSRRLANCVHPRLLNAMQLQNRGIKTANFYIIWNTNMPSILVETGFMDSTIDIVRLRNNAVMRNAGVEIAKGIMEYLGVRGNKTATSTPKTTPAPSKPAANQKLYRIRKSWNDSKSQIGAYQSLDAATKVAQGRSGYKVYNDAGKQVWPKSQMYRVRKSWSDAKSQKGAFKELAGAKAAADKHPGYNVYDADGKRVYKGQQSDNLFRVRKKWSDAKTQKGAFKELSSAKAEADKHTGYKVYDGNGKVVYTPSKKTEPKADKLFRVRKKWSDVKSQKGAFKELASAKAEADKHSGYRVFDGNGKVVYTPPTKPQPPKDNLYRVRKAADDSKSQKGAFKELSSAKAEADKHKGYHVFDDKMKRVYTSGDDKPKQKTTTDLYRVRKSAKDAKSQKGAFTELASAKALADANAGYKVYDGGGQLIYTPKKTSSKPEPAPANTLYRVRKKWTDAQSQVGAFQNLDSAKALADTYKGYSVFDDRGVNVYKGDAKKATKEAPKPVAPKDDKDHTGHTDIIGKMEVDAKRMAAFLKSVNPNFKDTDEVAKAFVAMGEKYGVRGDIAFAQSIIETGWFRFEGGTAVTPDQHNYCGMGVTSLGKKGNSFDTVQDGVEAQIQHLFGYATTDDIPSDRILSPRLQYVTRGIAPHWEDLSMRWAMNENYGKHILEVYDRMAAFNIKDEKNEKPAKDTPKAEAPKADKKEEVDVSLLNKVLDLAFSFFTKKKK